MNTRTEGVDDVKQVTVHPARDALARWTYRALEPVACDWLQLAMANIENRSASELAFGLAPRRTGHGSLQLSGEDLAEAATLLPGWHPELLGLDAAARILIACARSDLDGDALERLARHADVAEQSALYRGLPLYAAALDLDAVIGRGLRTHVTPVFEAIAHHNPWPAMHFDEHRWNHLVLKALFMEVSLAPVTGLEARANPTLQRMLLDFAAERCAAGRPVPDDLWHCVSDAAAADFHDKKHAA